MSEGAPAPGDLIAAVATPPGRGALGIVRLSGTGIAALFSPLLGREVLPPRRAVRADFLDAAGRALDSGLALFFAGPHSFTGEDVLELHAHGGPAVLQLLLARCLELGARPAEPGEFTRRAFLNDRIDLAQAESVADLIEASTAAAARAAVRSLKGELSAEVRRVVDGLIHLRAYTEATLDFPEEDVEMLEAHDARGKLAALSGAVGRLLAGAKQGNLLREGLHVVLLGQPNVGKSSLLNRLSGEELAIVTPVPGTTRDTVRGQVQVHGIPLHLVDTAGLRETADEVEAIGIERAWAAAREADLALVVIDETRGEDERAAWIEARLPAGLARIRVHNKIDLVAGVEAGARGAGGVADGTAGAATGTAPEAAAAVAPAVEVYVSAMTGAGIDALERAILELAGWGEGEEAGFIARERHLHALRAAGTHLDAAAARWPQLELFAEELRLAQEALATITGEFTSDDLLGEIFARFCIGK